MILVGPPPYARSWNAGRFFTDMNGELEVVRQLSGDETRDWLARLAAAPRPAQPGRTMCRESLSPIERSEQIATGAYSA